MTAKILKLADPSVVAVATQPLDGHMLRAIARQWPGGAPELFLEYVDFGDEAEPYVIKKQTKVDEFSASTIDALTWEEDRVVITTDSDSKQRQSVRRSRPTSESFETKAIRR